MEKTDLQKDAEVLAAACRSYQHTYCLSDEDPTEHETELWDLTEEMERLCQYVSPPKDVK